MTATYTEAAFTRQVLQLKSATGRLAPEQERWRAALENCPGVEYYLWRTHDWNRIESVLAWA